jgi:hypothetical protein
MTTAKNVKIDNLATYKVAAALRRKNLSAKRIPLPQEVHPVGGKIRVVLTGGKIQKGKLESMFGPSAISIPEFAEERKKQK